MKTKEQLSLENKKLKERLLHASYWMQREVEAAEYSLKKQSFLVRQKEKIDQSLLPDWNQVIHDYFGDAAEFPRFTIKRLLDTEIMWQLFQKHSGMDTIGMIIVYQKIFDSWLESNITSPFRKSMKSRNFHTLKIGETDRVFLEKIVEKKYTLSLGRLYEMLEAYQVGEVHPIVAFLQEQRPCDFTSITQSDFFSLFSQLVDREIFSRKRHATKMTYKDAQVARKIFVGNYQIKPSIFSLLFSARK